MTRRIRGRRRTLDRSKKFQLCELVARGATVRQAAATLCVSVRTVQRETQRDAQFDQELREAHAMTPDPLQIMQTAARTHWRAAAWLLERSDPERYGRRPASSCSPFLFDEGLHTVLEAALEVVEPHQRSRVYEHLQAACERAFKCVFPDYGLYGARRVPELPPTPLADAEHLKQLRDPNSKYCVSDYDQTGASLPAPPAEEGREVATPQAVNAAKLDVQCAPPSSDGHLASSIKPQASSIQPSAPVETVNPRTTPDPHAAPRRTRLAAASAKRVARPAHNRPLHLTGYRTRAAASASVFGEGILSPKTRIATEFGPDDKSPAGPPHSATSPHPVK
jgi:hypothetical protein